MGSSLRFDRLPHLISTHNKIINPSEERPSEERGPLTNLLRQREGRLARRGPIKDVADGASSCAQRARNYKFRQSLYSQAQKRMGTH